VYGPYKMAARPAELGAHADKMAHARQQDA
jgi:hypothetical protein